MGEALPISTKPKPTPTLLPPPSPPYRSPSKMQGVLAPLAILAYILSLPLIFTGIWLLFTEDYNCEEPLQMPHLRAAAGVGLLAVFAISNFVVYYGAKVLMPGIFVLTIPLVVMLMMGLALVGSYTMESRTVPASPMWIKMRIGRSEIWSNVKNCIYESQTCPDLAFGTIELAASDFSTKRLSPIESGCCKPPELCGMEYVNATYWNRVTEKDAADNGTAVTNSTVNPNTFGDCHAWSNEITELCYDCQSCKQGFLSTVHQRWKKLGVFLIVMSVLLITTHAVRFVILMVERYLS